MHFTNQVSRFLVGMFNWFLVVNGSSMHRRVGMINHYRFLVVNGSMYRLVGMLTTTGMYRLVGMLNHYWFLVVNRSMYRLELMRQ